MSKLPDRLSRYRSLEGQQEPRTCSIIRESVLHFSSPAKLNDPFDSRVRLAHRGTNARASTMVEKLIAKRPPHVPRAQRRQFARAAAKKLFRGEPLDDLKKFLQSSVDRVGVLSLSASAAVNLMWAHYGAGHTGLCLEFSTDNGFFGRAMKMKYHAEFVVPDAVLSTPAEQAEIILLGKAQEWSYEEEWRILDHDNGPGLRPYPPGALIRVILGARASDAHRALVESLVGQREPAPELWKAVLSEDAFAVRLEKCQL